MEKGLRTFAQSAAQGYSHRRAPTQNVQERARWPIGMSLALLTRGNAIAGKTAATSCRRTPEKWRFGAMTTDERDILELLKEELDFIESGGYGRSVRTPWQNKSTFQDSLSCINYGYPYRAHPCSECHLLDFVTPEHRTEAIPCHFIPLNTDGETIEDLELQDNQAKLEREVGRWLRERIKQIEEERANTARTAA
jgi:hypothetical protein